MTDLGGEVMLEGYRRQVSGLSDFDALYPGVSDDQLTWFVADAFSSAQLDGLLPDHSLDLGSMIVTPDLTNAQIALVQLYAAIRATEAKLLDLKSRVKYEAGPVLYEVEQTAAMVRDVLASLKGRLDSVKEQLRAGSQETDVYSGDLYVMADSQPPWRGVYHP